MYEWRRDRRKPGDLIAKGPGARRFFRIGQVQSLAVLATVNLSVLPVFLFHLVAEEIPALQVAGLGAVRLGSAGICEAFSMARRAEPAARLCTTPLSKAGSLTCPHTCSTGNLRHDSAPALAEPGEVLPLPG